MKPSSGHEPELLPAERFSNDYAPSEPQVPGRRGPHAGAVRSVLAGACAGRGRKPSSEECYEAMRAETPTSRQQTVCGVLVSEASLDDILLAHMQGASLKPLADAGGRERRV